ncbi:MAG: tetratricopeptide repeat protein [Candidatus Kapaibacterium sp.]
MAYDISDFATDVLERSHQIPVLVDFWADWCGPCKTLGPILERLAGEEEGFADSRWVLAKVDTETFPEEAAKYGVRGIPNVKLFVDGNVVDEFTGALPESAVRSWLEKALPTPESSRIAEARELIDEGEFERGLEILQEVMEAEPTNQLPRLMAAQVLLLEDPERGEELVQNIHADSELFDQAEVVRVMAALDRYVKTPDSLPESEVKSMFIEAATATREGDFDKGLEKFIDVIREDRYYADDFSRKACIAIFRLLGNENAITRKYRRTFDGALYV